MIRQSYIDILKEHDIIKISNTNGGNRDEKRTLASLMILGLLFSGLTVNAAGNSACEHVSMWYDYSVEVLEEYDHMHDLDNDGKPESCHYILKRNVTTYMCYNCGEVVDVIKYPAQGIYTQNFAQ